MVTNNLLKFVLNTLGGNNSTGSAYLALSTTDPGRDGTNITEPRGNGYERKLLGASSQTKLMGQPTENTITNKVTITNAEEIHFNEATGSWGEIKYFAIFTTKTDGTIYYSGQLTSPISPVDGSVVVIKKGELSISLSAEELSA